MSIKVRLKRLEKKVAANDPKPFYVPGTVMLDMWEVAVLPEDSPDGFGRLRWKESPTGEPFEIYCKRQQDELMALLSEKAIEMEVADDDAHKPASAGELAPLPEGRRRPNFIEYGGKEISADEWHNNLIAKRT